MPQMMPINWIFFFIFFISIFMIFITLNFYIFKYKSMKFNINLKKTPINKIWKW